MSQIPNTDFTDTYGKYREYKLKQKFRVDLVLESFAGEPGRGWVEVVEGGAGIAPREMGSRWVRLEARAVPMQQFTALE